MGGWEGAAFSFTKELKTNALSVYARLTVIGMFADIY